MARSSALNFRARHHIGWLSPRRSSDQRPDKRPQLSCSPRKWLAETTPTNRTEARGASSSLVPDNSVAGRSHSDRANRCQCNALTCRAHLLSGWLSTRRPNEQTRQEQWPHLSCPTKQWLTEPWPTYGKEARASASPVNPPIQWLDDSTPY